MIFLQCPDIQFTLEHGLYGKSRCFGSRQGGRVRYIEGQGRAPYGIGLGNSLLITRGIYHELNLSVFDHVHDMGSPFPHLIDLFIGDPMLGEEGGGAPCGHDLEAQVVEDECRVQQGHLVFILDTHKHRSRKRQFLPRRQLGFGKSKTKGSVDTHDLSSGLHFRAQKGVHSGKAGEGEDGFLH